MAEVLDPRSGDFDAGPVAPPVIPTEADTITEEFEPLGERGDVRFLRRERELHLVAEKRSEWAKTPAVPPCAHSGGTCGSHRRGGHTAYRHVSGAARRILRNVPRCPPA